jgi:hypothetical protein
MAGGINFTNQEWLVRSFDRNNNKVMDELQAEPHIQQRVDANKDGQISSQELVSALKADAVEVNQGRIVESRGFNFHVNGLETLKNVHSTAENNWGRVWTPTLYSDDMSRDRYHKLSDSNRAYDGAIDRMESSLRSIRDMTANAPDATSRALHIQAKTALSSASWRTWTARLQQNLSFTRDIMNDYSYQERPRPSTPANNDYSKDPFQSGSGNSGNPHGVDPFKPGSGNNGSPHGVDPFQPGNGTQPVTPNDPYADRLNQYIREQEMINSNLQAAYETLNTTLRSISEQTKDLPDVPAAVKATDGSIARAFSNIGQIQSSPKSPEQVATRLNSLADEQQAQATGRATPFAGIGAGVGAVGGGLIGFFAGGKNVKSAAIGAGVGAAVSAGIGGLIGHSIDMKYVGEAQTLRSLATDVSRYNPDADTAKLIQESQNTYNEMLRARDHHDLDNARVSTNNFNTIQGRVRPIEQESAKILGAYKK